jgi:hypothetical protein
MNNIDVLEIIHDLAEINQQLSWESPVDQELRFRVIKTIEKLERQFEHNQMPPVYHPAASAHAQRFLSELYGAFAEAETNIRHGKPLPKQIRKKHMTLVWSKK